MTEYFKNRVLLLDGAMGTMVQRYCLSDTDYKGERFKDLPNELKGCHDILSLTQPDIICSIHHEYLEAGADIITTNSFNSNSISLADYGLSDLAYEIARGSALIARKAADEFSAKTPDKPRFVAGTVGPTNKTASMSADIMDPSSRDVSFDQLKDAYQIQIKGLLDGGADIILIETVFDTLNAKAALQAVENLRPYYEREIPVMISATLSDASGRTLSGQTLEAFYSSVSHAGLLSVGLNCAFGPSQLLPYIARLDKIAGCLVSCHPNAGLPNQLGEYDETPDSFAEKIKEFLIDRHVNIIGGCCGTTPEHIRKIAGFINEYTPRIVPPKNHTLTLSNLDSLIVSSEKNFINIGERTNVAGSAKFARLIREGNFSEAVNIARRQIDAGAQIIDICMDAPLIDGPKSMETFLRLIGSDPEISRVPVMIDSSDWTIIETGLKNCQGKSIVNSISLKEGEEEFLRRARLIRKYGAAAVAMLFDERGQADTFDRKIEVARRSYDLLTNDGFAPEDIIFDPNILTIATGVEESERYALDFINAVKWIKSNLPYVHISGGVSNLSFSFRGNNPIREALHSVFLYHAVSAGLDMAIVNSQMLKIYDDIDPRLIGLIEDVIFVRRPDATERLLEFASEKNSQTVVKEDTLESPEKSVPSAYIRKLLIKGSDDGLNECLIELRKEYASGLEIIEKILMPVMEEIGMLFGEGKMFLPQVIKSARVLKLAISSISDSMMSESSLAYKGKVIIATVRGDIHDIGKNIVSLVVGCNGFEVLDLGVMADASRIADEALRHKPIAVLLSGLITPSLNEMVEVCRELQRRGLDIPVIVGGATTSPLHTALKIAPEYDGLVLHSPDASCNARFLAKLSSSEKDEFTKEMKDAQKRLVENYEKSSSGRMSLLTLEEARQKAVKKKHASAVPAYGEKSVFVNFDINEIESFIDWDAFFSSWEIRTKSDSKSEEERNSLKTEALRLLDDIKRNNQLRLQAVFGWFPARGENEDIVITADDMVIRMSMIRDLSPKGKGECVADFIAEKDDYVCLFALTAGVGLKSLMDRLRVDGKDFDAIMVKFISDRLTEAFAVKLQTLLMPGNTNACRLAFGYPAIPDHSLKRFVFDLLDVENQTEMRLIGNDMISPEESICGILLNEGHYFTPVQ